MMGTNTNETKILILATLSGGYAGADSVGQLHAEYAPNTYVVPCLSPCMFPEEFYLRTFERGIDAILVMYSGTDCPFKCAPERTAEVINRVYPIMKERGIDTRRLRLVAICTVCTKPFIREVEQMNELLQQIGPVWNELSATPAPQSQAAQSKDGRRVSNGS
jgi:coenzyme F420-reducing hydrogenase delta subunit